MRGNLLSIEGVDAFPARPIGGEWVRVEAEVNDASNGSPPYPLLLHSYTWHTDVGEFLEGGPRDVVTYEPYVNWGIWDCPESGTAHMSVTVDELQFECNHDEAAFTVDWAPREGHDGCPIFERTEQSQWHTLNSLLSQCAYDSVIGETVDYFQFPESPSPSMSPLEFRIREGTPGEVSTVDFVELWRIDHTSASKVLVTDGGTVLQDDLRKRAASVHDRLGRNLTRWFHVESDSQIIVVEGGDTLTCVFPDSSAGPSIGRVVVRGKLKLQLAVAAPNPLNRGVKLCRAGASGVATVYPRMDWSNLVVDGLAIPRGDGISDTVRVAVDELHEFDYIGLVLETGTVQKTVVPVGSAIHSVYGSVKPKVAAVDTLNTTIASGENVLLAFPRPPLQNGMTRDLVLRVVGRYDLGGGTPREPEVVRPWGIDRIWPNPTRGGATMLYVSTAGGPSRFKIFDVTGRLVRTIEYPATAGGQHFAMWDGLDGRGERVGSGVYFVQLEQSHQKDRRKVIVLR